MKIWYLNPTPPTQSTCRGLLPTLVLQMYADDLQKSLFSWLLHLTGYQYMNYTFYSNSNVLILVLQFFSWFYINIEICNVNFFLYRNMRCIYLKEILSQSSLLLHIIFLDWVLPGDNNCISVKYSDILSLVSSWGWTVIHLVWWEALWEGCIYINIPLPFYYIPLDFSFSLDNELKWQKW